MREKRNIYIYIYMHIYFPRQRRWGQRGVPLIEGLRGESTTTNSMRLSNCRHNDLLKTIYLLKRRCDWVYEFVCSLWQKLNHSSYTLALFHPLILKSLPQVRVLQLRGDECGVNSAEASGSSMNCDVTASRERTTLLSPHYPSPSPNNLNCLITIRKAHSRIKRYWRRQVRSSQGLRQTHIFCLNPSIVVELGYEWHFMLSLFKFCEKKYLKSKKDSRLLPSICPPFSLSISLFLEEFDLEQSDGCQNDYLNVGGTKFCGTRTGQKGEWGTIRVYLNPLLPETFFQSNFEIQPKIDSHRLPTHRRGAYRNFFHGPFFKKKKRNFNYTMTIIAVS